MFQHRSYIPIFKDFPFPFWTIFSYPYPLSNREPLNKSRHHESATIRKSLLLETNFVYCFERSKHLHIWLVEQWKNVIFSGEISCNLFPTIDQVYVWIQSKQELVAFNLYCLTLTVEHGGVSLMIYGVISWKSTRSNVSFHGKINSQVYLIIVLDQNHLRRLNTIFQVNAPIHKANVVSEWHEEYSGEAGHFIGSPQSADLNVVKHLWF